MRAEAFRGRIDDAVKRAGEAGEAGGGGEHGGFSLASVEEKTWLREEWACE